MIDTLMHHRERALMLPVLEQYGLEKNHYALLTLHRPSNVDVPETLKGIIEALATIQQHLPVLFPIHPRTMQRLETFGLRKHLEALPKLRCIEPLGYLEFLNLTANARLVLTDSGGIQEETTILGIPCLTLRDNTERPVTVTEGTNLVIGSNPERIAAEAERILKGAGKQGRRPLYWDGQAAKRIIQVLLDHQDRILAGLQR